MRAPAQFAAESPLISRHQVVCGEIDQRQDEADSDYAADEGGDDFGVAQATRTVATAAAHGFECLRNDELIDLL